ncbi:unnamed protein product [Alopecurus aequalis]
MEAAGDDSMDMFGGSRDTPAATIGRRFNGVTRNLNKMEKALRGAFLDIHSIDESTIHPANGPLIEALRDLVQSARHTNEHCSHMLDCWASRLEKDAEMVRRGEKGRKYMFLLNNTCGVLQIMRRTGASFSNAELVITSMIQRYKKSYFDECWVPLKNTLHLNLDKFTAEFLATCDNQRTWKVTAEVKYELRQEMVDLIVPPYEVTVSALQANRSGLSGVLCSFERAIAGKKKQKKYTGEKLEEEIMALFEG